jgi:hypothetical protein
MTVAFLRLKTTQYTYGINPEFITHWYISDDVLRVYFADGVHKVFRADEATKLVEFLEDNSLCLG